MISRTVEISIAGGGGEMVRAYLLVVFFFVISSLLCLKVQKTHAVQAMEIKNL